MMLRLCFLLIAVPVISLAQPRLEEKFVNDNYNENNYLIFNADSTFKYRLAYHLIHDIACGRYKTINDTIFLFYQSDMRDNCCNDQIDADYHFDSATFIFRPTKLFYRNNRLYQFRNGEIAFKTEKFQLNRKPHRDTRKYYHRKYLLLGPWVADVHKTYYMVVASQAKWLKKRKKSKS